jgi:hypothetical protein
MAKMINKTLVLTYIYLLIYIILSSGVILYNKVIADSTLFVYLDLHIVCGFFACCSLYKLGFEFRYECCVYEMKP